MIQINGLKEGLELFKALGSDVRMRIVKQLNSNGEMNLNELATVLELTNGALTPHIRQLEEQNIITVETRHSTRGLQKVCRLKESEILLNVYPSFEEENAKVYQTDISIGHYTDFSMHPDCGLVSEQNRIGAENDPRCFSYPERFDAQMLWFHDGYIEYHIPNLLPEKQRILQLTVSFEISSANQGVTDTSPSEIEFFLNGRKLCSWTALTEPGNTRGIYTPPWWIGTERQHGYLKMLVINNVGVFLDGVMIQGTGADWPFLDENGEMRFRIETHPENGQTSGGLALYGKHFGNYNQDILAIVHYMPEESINRIL